MKQTSSRKKASSRYYLDTFIAYFFIMLLVFHQRFYQCGQDRQIQL